MKIPDKATIKEWRRDVKAAAVKPRIPSKAELHDIFFQLYFKSSYGENGLNALRAELSRKPFRKRMRFITKQFHAFEKQHILSQQKTPKSIWKHLDPHLNGILSAFIGKKGLFSVYVKMYQQAIATAQDFHYGSQNNAGIVGHHRHWAQAQRSILGTS